MIEGFVKLDSSRFYTEAWGKIKETCRNAANLRQDDDYDVVIKSNWKEAKECIKAGVEPPEIVIYWGFTNKETDEKTILAVSRSGNGLPEDHWVSPILLENV